MLSEQEQRLLADIERQLAIDDPKFAAILASGRPPEPRRPTAFRLFVCAYSLLMVAAFIMDHPVLNTLLMVVTGVLLGYLAVTAMYRRHERRRWR